MHSAPDAAGNPAATDSYLGVRLQQGDADADSIELDDGYDPSAAADKDVNRPRPRSAVELAPPAVEEPAGLNPRLAIPAQSRGGQPSQQSIAGCVVMLEHPRPWADDPLDTNTLPSAARARLRSLTGLGVRVAFVQRSAGASGLSLFCSVPHHSGLILQRELGGVDELADLDLSAVLRAAAHNHAIPDGFTEAEPQFVVTAHASAEQRRQGAALAAAMTRLDPENVWESSDLVSDSATVSVVVLPKGHVSTEVELADADALVDAGWQDRVLLTRFAGRLQDTEVVRLAESMLRQRLGADTDTSVQYVDATATPVASGSQDDAAPTTITRIVTTWRVFPNLVHDASLAPMRPELSKEPQRTWRVVVDRTIAGDRLEGLSVVEVGDINAPGGGVQAWDVDNVANQPLQLPNPTVVSEVSALPPGRALDLGCGMGRHAVWLAENGWQVTGVDFSRSGLRRMAEEARVRKVGVRAELADLRMWAPGGAKFDLILVSDVHLDDVFQRTSNWLSPTGRIIVIGPAKGSGRAQVVSPIDYVHLAARATGARLRVLRAGEVEGRDDSARRDALVVASWPG